MGNDVHQNQAMTLKLIHHVVWKMEQDCVTCVCNEERKVVVNQVVLLLVGFFLALHEVKVFKLNLRETRNLFLESTWNIKLPHIVASLWGRFEEETGDTFHFVTVTCTCNSNLQIRNIQDRSIKLKEIKDVNTVFFRI